MSFVDSGVDDWIAVAPSQSRAVEIDDWIAPAAAAPAEAPVGPGGGYIPPTDRASMLAPGGGADYPIEFGKGFVEGAKNLPASSLKGMGVIAATAGPDNARRQIAVMDRVDRGEVIPDTEDQLGYQHMSPEQRAQARAEYAGYMEQNRAPVTEHPLYRAGEAIEEFGKETLAPRPGFESGKSWTRDIGGGFGSVAAGIATSMIPGVGMAAAPVMFGTAGMGEAADRAVKAGATDQQVGQAARLGTIAGATDVVDILLPMMGGTGRALGFIRRVGFAAVAGSLAEGGQEGLQQFIQNAIAQGIYKPEQDLLEDVPRSMAIGMIVGGTTAGGFSAAQGSGAPDAPYAPYASAVPQEEFGGTPQNVPGTVANEPGVPPSAPPVTSVTSATTAPEDDWLFVEPQQPASAEIRQDLTVPAAPPTEIDALPPTVIAPPPPPGRDLTPQDDLQALFDDPRSVEEIRAELAAARAWQPTSAWQPIPPGASQDGLEVKVGNAGTLARIPPAPGSREAPLSIETPEDVNAGSDQTATPTIAQADAGNYQKRHVKWRGLDIAIETEQGQERTGIGADGKPWSVVMPAPYGYIKRTKGKDGDQLDVYIGPNPQSTSIFVVDQVDPDTRRFDEHKALLGFPNEEAARQAYEAAFSDGTGQLRAGAVSPMTIAQFKAWVANGNTTKAIAYTEPKQPRGPVNRGPLSLVQFLASKGGIQDQGGELRALGLTANFVPGFGRLVRPSGLTLDMARERAVEAGYLQDTPWEGGVAVSTVRDLLDALDQESRGQRLYSSADLAAVREREEGKQVKDDAARRKAVEADLAAIAKDNGATLTPDELRAAADAVTRHGADPSDALVDVLEASAYATHDDLVASETQDRADEPTAQDDAPGADQHGAGPPAPGEQPAGPRSESAQGSAPGSIEPAGGEQDRTSAEADGIAPDGADDWVTSDQSVEVNEKVEPQTEATPAGEQAVIPGAEKIGQGEQAQRKADEPLKPTKAQKPADEGLFGDESQQTDLVDLTRKPQRGPLAREVAKHHMFAYDEGFAGNRENYARMNNAEQAAHDRGSLDRSNADRAGEQVPAAVAPKPAPTAPVAIDDEATASALDKIRAAMKAPSLTDIDENDIPAFLKKDAVVSKAQANLRTTPGLYSAVSRAIDSAKQPKASLDQWLGMLRNAPGVKQEEMAWLGLEDWLREQSGSVTKDAVQDYVRANQIEVRETEKGGTKAAELEKQWERAADAVNAGNRSGMSEARLRRLRKIRDDLREQARAAKKAEGETKFSQYTLPGGENYRELLLTLPDRGPRGEDVYALGASAAERPIDRPIGHSNQFTSSHWDQPNVIAHIRFNDRTIDGKKTLFVEEVQSDWHQVGKKKGYAKDTHGWTAQLLSAPDAGFTHWQINDANGNYVTKIVGGHAESAIRKAAEGVPDAPFKTTWPELAMKRVIRYAAENGYEKVAWTPGQVQADRYDLSKRVEKIDYNPESGKLWGYDKSGAVAIDTRVPKEKLADHLGKDVADKLLNTAADKGWHRLTGTALKVDAPGMLRFYDDILPATVNKMVKKFGGKVGSAALETPSEEPTEISYRIEQGSNSITREPLFAVTDSDGNTYDVVSSRAEATALIRRLEDIDTAGIEDHEVHTLDITPALRDAAMGEGFPMFRLGTSSAAVKARGDIEARISEIVDRMVGRRVKVHFPNTIPIGRAYSEWGSFGADKQTAAGVWSNAHKAILVAMADPNYGGQVSTAYHEAFHAVETLLLTPQEIAVLEREEAALRRLIKRHLNLGAMTDAQFAEIAGQEVRALAFEAYVRKREAGKASGIHISLRRLFDRIANFLRAVRNAMHGLGFKTADDVFAAVYEGKVRREADETERSTMKGAGKTIDRGDVANLRETPIARIDLPTEVVTDHLEARNLPRLARIARKVDKGRRANTTETRVKLQDKFLRWQKIQAQIEKATGQPLPEALNAWLAESLYYGRTGERLEQLDKKHIDPLIDDIQKRGLTLDGVNDFLMARHAPERNAVLAERNGVENGSGMSDEEAARVLSEIDASGKRRDYNAIERQVREIIDETRIALLSGGLISQQTFDAWYETYPLYVPLRGFAENTETEDARPQYGKGYDIRGPEARKAEGRSSLADSPLGYVLLQAQQAIVRAEKAKVGRAALRLVSANPMPGLWEIHKSKTAPSVDPVTGLTIQATTDPLLQAADNVFAVKIDGVPYFIEFKGEYGRNLARALKNLGTANMNTAMQFIATLTRIQARLATTLNPDFMIPNMARDLGEAFINMQEVEQRGFVKAFAKHLPGALGGSFLALAGKDGGRYAQAFREFDEAGGRIRFFGLENVDDIKANVASKMRRLEGGVINTARAAGEKAIEYIEVANGSIENATRLAVYMAARDVGFTKPKAASMAREMTVNFNRKGEWGSAITAAYMFANAATQGMTRMVSAMQHKRVRRAAYVLAASGAAMTLYNIGAGGDDEDGIPFYLKVPHWIRDTNMILMWPKGFGRDGKYIKVPLPFGYSFFHVIGARSTGVALGKEKPGKAASAIAKSTLDAFDPLGKDENMLAQFTPTLARPAVHIGTNQNWTGRPINPTPPPGKKHEPDSSQHFRSASPFAVGAAEKLNRWTGGTRHEPGAIDWSPGSIDYMIGFVSGGLGRFVKNSVETGMNAWEGKEWQVDKTPIVRRFVGGKDAMADRALYYEERSKVMAAHDRRESYGKEKNEEAGKRLKTEAKSELAAYGFFRRADDKSRDLRKDIDKAKADPALSPADREKKLKALEADEIAAMNVARQRLYQFRGSALPQ